jgi:hypothetical protein
VDLWPRLSLLVCWNSASARYYRGWLQRVAPDVPLIPFSTTGTEGIVTLPVDSHTCAGPLANEQGLFEFVPCEPSDPGTPLAPDVETYEPYALDPRRQLPAGDEPGQRPVPQRHRRHRPGGGMGRGPSAFDFEGRGGCVSSFTGEKLTESDVHAAIRSAVGHSSINHGFCVVPVWGQPPGLRPDHGMAGPGGHG